MYAHLRSLAENTAAEAAAAKPVSEAHRNGGTWTHFPGAVLARNAEFEAVRFTFASNGTCALCIWPTPWTTAIEALRAEAASGPVRFLDGTDRGHYDRPLGKSPAYYVLVFFVRRSGLSVG